jgi:hypothetical protein
MDDQRNQTSSNKAETSKKIEHPIKYESEEEDQNSSNKNHRYNTRQQAAKKEKN